ncbi:MAG: polyprenyl synthetase family protein, partial [SAR202 cluster bacterium]|nr:polyprenyl synthetase family protein [SAR202 cluster bacterium]
MDTVRGLRLIESTKRSVLEALSGSSRVLPDGKPTACSAITYLAFESAGGQNPQQVVPNVAAMEMLMAAYDVIDDIQDDEEPLPEDRHAFGELFETVSILLLAAHSEIVKASEFGVPMDRVITCLKLFDQMGIQSWRGQTLDMRLETQHGVSIKESLQASQLKSASLVRCAAQMGAALVTDHPEQIDLYGEYGWHVGIVAQLMNDAAGVWPGGANKSDLRLRKKTLPIAYALNLPPDTSEHIRTVQDFYDADETSTSRETDVKQALWSCGAIHYTWMIAAQEKVKAKRIGHTLAGESFSSWPLARLL